MSHPARFTPSIVTALGSHLRSKALKAPGRPIGVHDPFGGTGERLGALCDELGLNFSGTEIEPEFIMDTRVRPGDSTLAETYPLWRHLVCTSPTYPNGVNDHFKASDKSKRYTYRSALAGILGHDRPLHPNNTGQHGNRFRRSRKSEDEYWRLHHLCVRWWPEWVIVNVKDVVAERYTVHVVAAWRRLLGEHGYLIYEVEKVPVTGIQHSPNRVRAETESIIVARDPLRARP